SVIIGYPTFRLRGPYFTIATIGVGEAVRVVASSLSFAGGASGLRMPAGSYDFESNFRSMTLLAVALVWIALAISRSAFGSALSAVRQDIDAAEALGVNSTRLKVTRHSIPALLSSSLLIYGALLIAVMLFEPKGLLGLVRRLWARRLRRFYIDA